MVRPAATLVAIGFAVLSASAASAAEYVVQIGAFRRPSQDFAAAARQVGEVTTVVTSSGVTLFQVGTFGSFSEANEARSSLRAAGYADAFVRRARRSAASLPAVSAAPPAEGATRFERLPAELQARTVYLDGRLHVKEGDRFIPLSEYEGGRYR